MISDCPWARCSEVEVHQPTLWGPFGHMRGRLVSFRRLCIAADGVSKYIFWDNSVLILNEDCGYVTHIDSGADVRVCSTDVQFHLCRACNTNVYDISRITCSENKVLGFKHRWPLYAPAGELRAKSPRQAGGSHVCPQQPSRTCDLCIRGHCDTWWSQAGRSRMYVSTSTAVLAVKPCLCRCGPNRLQTK